MAGRTTLVVRHVAFEDPGSLGSALVAHGCRALIADSSGADLERIDALAPDLLVLLGGPVGVYDTVDFPFLNIEIEDTPPPPPAAIDLGDLPRWSCPRHAGQIVERCSAPYECHPGREEGRSNLERSLPLMAILPALPKYAGVHPHREAVDQGRRYDPGDRSPKEQLARHILCLRTIGEHSY